MKEKNSNKYFIKNFRYPIWMILLTYISIPYLSRGQKIKNEPDSIKTIKLQRDVLMQFRWINPGTFYMGSTDSEIGRDKDEGPRHEVNLTNGFYLGIFEVTQAQWQAVMGVNPSVFQQGEETSKRPVESVSWADCNKFVKILNSKGNDRFRLPTEAEWEYACRAGSESPYYWQEGQNGELVFSYSWCNSRSYATTHAVGLKLPNAWGLYDMCGNVWEWCSDWYDAYQGYSVTDPAGPQSGKEKVFRGGSWYDFPVSLRSANRHRHEPEGRYTSIGLRLVLEREVLK
jgi:formylglycine-generating enzyme required for sulfatase activity